MYDPDKHLHYLFSTVPGCAAAKTLQTDTPLYVLKLPCMCFDCNHKTHVAKILPAL